MKASILGLHESCVILSEQGFINTICVGIVLPHSRNLANRNRGISLEKGYGLSDEVSFTNIQGRELEMGH